MRTHVAALVLAIAACATPSSLAGDGGDAFTYQGQLRQNGAAAAGPLDLVFRIYDSATDGLQVGSSVAVANFVDFDEAGRFTVEIPFASTSFSGAARWLEIEVDGVVLTPRQRINPVPYATRSLEVAAVNNAALSGTYSNALNLSNPSNTVSGTFTGSGANLNSLNASSMSSGTLASGRLSGSYGNILSFLNLSNQFAGNGSGLTSLNASNIASGTLGGSLLGGTYGNALTMTNPANQFGGNGAALTSLNASNIASGTVGGSFLNGTYGNALTMTNVSNQFGGNGSALTSLNASNLASGTLASARLSGAYGNALTMTNATNVFGGDGSALTGLNASNLASGTLASGRLSGTYGNALTMSNALNQFGGNGAALTSLNASNIASGTVGGSFLSGTYGNALTMTNALNQFGGNGSALTNLNAGNVASGTLASGRLSGAYDNPLFMQNALNVFGGIGAGLTQLNASNVSSGTLNAARLPAGGAWPLSSALTLDATTLVVDAPSNRVGIGTSAPQVALSVVGGVNVDEADTNNGGLPSSLRFGSFSGEAISSTRTAGANTFGLDLWTGGSKRVSITNDGRVGFGTTAPTARLHMPATGGGQAVEFPGLRIYENASSPNVVGGHAENAVTDPLAQGVVGVTIGGGGLTGALGSNTVSSSYGTVAGGYGNKVPVNSVTCTIGGGHQNEVQGEGATIAGGRFNAAHGFSTIGGGSENTTDAYGTVGGGEGNEAGFAATVGGGKHGRASGQYSTVPGGLSNSADGDYSFAAGESAWANHANTFVWSDGTDGTIFTSTAPNQFLILATGGVGINTEAPTSSLQVNGGIRARGGSPGGAGANNNGFAFAGNGGDNDSGMFSSADGQLEFYSNANELMRISPGGNVGIGTNNPGSKLEVNGSAAKPGGGLWSVSSDARLKKNIAPLAHSLEDLLRLHGVTYEYIDPAAINELEGTRIGFIAQNVEEVFPDWVDFGPNGFRRLTIRGFEAVAVEAIRELREEKDAEIQALHSELDATRERLARLESMVGELARIQRANGSKEDRR